MSLTVRKLLDLPSLRGARLVAGTRALERPVSSVSVLEYSEPSQTQSELFEAISFEGSEIVITAFANICNDSSAQVAVIRRLAAAGEVGLMLYYVGTFVPEISDEVKEVADKLSFALIEMPHDKHLRYSDAISDICEAIFRQEVHASSFVTEILEEVSLLPESLRSVSTVLRMLRDRLRASLILSDPQGRVINISSFPHGREEELGRLFESGSLDSAWHVDKARIHERGMGSLMLTVVRENGTGLTDDQLAMTVETLHLFLVIWSPKHGQAVIAELVRAILQDESLKMRRLADLFSIDVKSIDTMFTVKGEGLEESLDEVKSRLEPYIARPIVDLYQDSIVLFLASSMGGDVLEAVSSLLAYDGDRLLVRAFNLKDTSAVRKAFLLVQSSADLASKVYRRKVLDLVDVQLVDYFLSVLAKGEDEIASVLSPLAVLDEMEEGTVLTDTLEAFLLNADMSTLQTSRMLGVHNNTVKYRLKRISSILHADIMKAPQNVMLYRALMMRRIIGLGG